MMKLLRMKLTLAATMAGVLLSGAALARGCGGHGGGGGFHGGGVGGFHGGAFVGGGFRGPGFGGPVGFRGAVVARPGFGGTVFVRPGFVRPVNRVFVGVGVGVPVFWPYWPGPAYFPPAVVAVPASPPVFIEQGGGQTAQQSFWYWCNDFRAYYPYVKECPGGWQPVVPQAVPPSQ